MTHSFSTDDRYVAAYLMAVGFPMKPGEEDTSYVRFTFNVPKDALEHHLREFHTNDVLQGFITNFNEVNRTIRTMKPKGMGGK